MKKYIKYLIIAVLGILLASGIVVGVVNINKTDDGMQIKTEIVIKDAEVEYASEEVPALISEDSGQGSIEINEIPTVEAVDSNGPVTDADNTTCPEGEECGQGAYVPTLDISSPQAFANQVLGQCIDVDGYYGSQCWDVMAAYFINYTGHTLYTCGTGAAKGTIADGCWQRNAGDQFTMIWDATQIQAGDIAVYSTGTWGHIGMAMGGYNNGYFTLLGQNQGGPACQGGGAAGNIINLSTRDFIGAFRPNIYVKPAPTPEPTPTDLTYTYVAGDYFSKVLVNLGLDEGNLWGKSGTVAYYTQQLVEQNVLDKRGNVLIGVPFTLHRR